MSNHFHLRPVTAVKFDGKNFDEIEKTFPGIVMDEHNGVASFTDGSEPVALAVGDWVVDNNRSRSVVNGAAFELLYDTPLLKKK